MPTLKQTQDEFGRNLDVVVADLKSVGAELSDSPGNVSAVINWLRNNCTENNIIDGSQQNIRRGIEALNGVGALEWITPLPKTRAETTPEWDYSDCPVPQFLDFVKTKHDIRTISQDGRLQKYFKTRWRDQLNARINFILKHNIGWEAD